ncbi:MAG: hypothetical protein WBP00_10825 [Saprospiraceae bacterium]|jgi:hypothetical protein
MAIDNHPDNEMIPDEDPLRAEIGSLLNSEDPDEQIFLMYILGTDEERARLRVRNKPNIKSEVAKMF